MMKAALMTTSKKPDGIVIKEIDKPVPKKREVCIRIHATTVTSGDVIMRKLPFLLSGIFEIIAILSFGYKSPRRKILGHELAGEIEAVGNQVRGFKIGDQVFASTGLIGGAHAEYICLHESGMVASKPKSMTFEKAAAVPVGAVTALNILRKGNIQAGQKVLIYGASGSVGSFAVQLAKYHGAEVTGVCSTANVELVKSTGADKVIDYTAENFAESGETYDIVFDAVGKITKSQCKRILDDTGSFVSVKSILKEKREDLIFLSEIIDDGKVKSVIDRTYPLEDIVEAHRYVDTGRKRGNVVITLD